MTDKHPFEMSAEELQEHMDKVTEIEATHIWLYGTHAVYCILCSARKGSKHGQQRCLFSRG